MAATTQAEAAATVAIAAGQALTTARQDATCLKAASDGAERLAAFEAEQPAVETKRSRVEAASRAQRLVGEEATAAATAGAATRAAADKLTSKEALATAEARLSAARQALGDADAREQQAQAAAAEAARLEALASQAAALAESGRAATEAAAARAQAREELQRRSSARDAAIEVLTAAANARQAAASLAERVNDRRAALTRAKSRAADVAEHAKAEKVAARAVQEVATTRSAAEAATAALDAARSARIEAERTAWANAAARLATTLAEGEACPVCGSHEHPAPAHAVLDGEPDVDAARSHEAVCDTAERTASTAHVQAEAAFTSAVQRRDEYAARVAAGETGASPDAELADATAALKASEAAAAGLKSLADRLEKAQVARHAAEASVTEQSDSVAMAQETATSTSSVHTSRLAEVPPEARDPAALAKATAAAKAATTTLQAALTRDRREEAAAGASLTSAQVTAQQAAERARDALEVAARAEAALLAASRAQGFADLAAYRAARLPAEDGERLTAQLKQHDEALAVARESHRQAAQAAQGLEMPDLPALEAAAQSQTAVAQEARSRAGGVQQRAQAAAERLERIRAEDLAFATARERHAVMQNLAKQASGQNALRLSFEGFVLASLLDEALAAANDHLQRMLGGRYRVQRREEPLRANAAVGLDIEVLDEWTGQARPAGTLSGGEGFCAALALALGLADTVQAHAGARPVDALLVDEGFGSLDEEALDKALEVLAGLQGSNRIVGIISHVPELKTRIPARLEVTPGVRGSTARFVMA
jgi:exonuclease SbcC